MKEIYICMCCYGEYEDYQEESFVAYVSKSRAENIITTMVAELDKLEIPDYPTLPDEVNVPDDVWEKAIAARAEVEKKIIAIFKTVDWECSGTGMPEYYLEAKFYVTTLELRE